MEITVKRRTLKYMTLSVLLGFFLAGLILGVFTYSHTVYGVNNTSVLVLVNVTNTEPILYEVVVSPDPVDLSPGALTTVNCTGFVYEFNGYDDVVEVNATLYQSSASNLSEDNNYRYSNNSCQACSQHNGGSLNASCTCLFSVEYFANNGSWVCNMTVFDSQNVNDSNNTAFVVNPLIALNTTNLINYGNLTVLQTSTKQAVNITNFGNQPLNLTVRGHAGVDDTESEQNWSFTCAFNNITRNQHRFTINESLSFDEMTPVPNSTTNIGNLTLAQRTNDAQIDNDYNSTYFQLRVPLSVGGVCNGTLHFQASSANQ